MPHPPQEKTVKVKPRSLIKYAVPKPAKQAAPKPAVAKQPDSLFTTMAVGEEGGSKPGKPGGVTTMTLGEEGGAKPGKPGGVTTMAVGEEGGNIK